MTTDKTSPVRGSQQSISQETLTAFGEKVDAFAASLNGEEQQWLAQLLTAANDAMAVQGYAFNGFVNFGDIKGESTDKDHKDWVMLSPSPYLFGRLAMSALGGSR
jgi:hypothetical protein